jgi:hypothetical protein
MQTSRWRMLFVAAVALLALAMLHGPATGVARADDGEVQVDSFNVNGTPVELSNGYPVPYVSDCDPGEAPPRCGAPPAQWSASMRPVPMCTVMTNLPPWLDPEQFREDVRQAAAVWNGVEAAIGIVYNGDCAALSWQRRDGENQIAFDDERNLVTGATLGLTESSISWSPPTNPTVRRIDEADIIIESTFANVPTCLLSTLTHEMGHALGFGHSTNPDDLMYASVDLSRPETCHLVPSESEKARLQDLYGIDRSPTVSMISEQAVPTGYAFSMHAQASDPEGEALFFEWDQLSGQPVELNVDGPQASFTSPNNAGILEFRVTALDPYQHFASAQVRVTAYVSQGHLTYGAVPPDGGSELVIFGGGGNLDLVVASGCPPATATFWTTDDDGNFVIYLPGTDVAVVNAAWDEKFGGNIPAGTPLLGRCV